MTDVDALNRFLALNVMGWTIHKDVYLTECGYERRDDWNPHGSLADCEPLLNQIERDKWKWRWCVYDGYRFVMWQNTVPEKKYLVDGDTRTAALCECVAKAYGFKNE